MAQEAADLGLPGVDQPAIDHDADFPVIVAEVAVVGAGPEVDPFTDIGVAQEPIVVLVAVTLHNAGLDLAAYPAVRSQRRAGPDFCSQHVGARANQTRSRNA